MPEERQALIEEWLRHLTPLAGAREFVVLALGRALAKDPEFVVDPSLDADHGLYRALASNLNPHVVTHVVDWIVSAVLDEAPWLKRTDDLGRPLKLLKIGTLEQAVHEADKAMAIANQRNARIAATGDDEEPHRDLGGGWSLVRLTSTRALDLESSRMQHCIGNGAYDASLVSGKRTYLSLRDPYGKPHATLELEGGYVLQAQGKQNRMPIADYVDRLLPYLRAECRLPSGIVANLGLVMDDASEIHRRSELPDVLSTSRTLDLDLPAGHRIPRDELFVGGDLRIVNRGEPATMPSLLQVRGRLTLVGPFRFPGKTRLHAESIVLIGGSFEGLPDDFGAVKSFEVHGPCLDRLPSLLRTDELTIDGVVFDEMPERCRPTTIRFVDGGIRRLPDDLAVERMFLDGSVVERFPRGLQVRNDLNVVVKEGGIVPALGDDTTIHRLSVQGARETIAFPPSTVVSEIVLDDCHDQVIPGMKRPIDLVVRNCLRTTFPPNVSGTLYILGGHDHLMPDRMSVASSLEVRGQVSLTLPDGLVVKGSTKIVNVVGKVTLGSRTELGGRVTFAAIEDLSLEGGLLGTQILHLEKVEMVRGLGVRPDGISGRFREIQITACGTATFPVDLTVEGDVFVRETGHVEFGATVDVGGSLRLENAGDVELPPSTRIGGSLIFSSLGSALAIGADSTIGCDLEIIHAERIDIGENIWIAEDLEIGDLVPPVDLPDRLHVRGRLDGHRTVRTVGAGSTFGDLDLGAGMIRSLPEGLTVTGDLNVGATDIVALPEDIRVGGTTILPEAFVGRPLPSGIDPTRVELEGAAAPTR